MLLVCWHTPIICYSSFVSANKWICLIVANLHWLVNERTKVNISFSRIFQTKLVSYSNIDKGTRNRRSPDNIYKTNGKTSKQHRFQNHYNHYHSNEGKWKRTTSERQQMHDNDDDSNRRKQFVRYVFVTSFSISFCFSAQFFVVAILIIFMTYAWIAETRCLLLVIILQEKKKETFLYQFSQLQLNELTIHFIWLKCKMANWSWDVSIWSVFGRGNKEFSVWNTTWCPGSLWLRTHIF